MKRRCHVCGARVRTTVRAGRRILEPHDGPVPGSPVVVPCHGGGLPATGAYYTIHTPRGDVRRAFVPTEGDPV